MNQAKMSMEFVIHPALWDAIYVGRQYVSDKPMQSDDMDTIPSARYTVRLWFNTWTTEWTIAMKIAQQIRRMHAWNIRERNTVWS